MLFVMFSASVLSYTLKPFRRIPQIFPKILRRNRQKSPQIPSGPSHNIASCMKPYENKSSLTDNLPVLLCIHVAQTLKHGVKIIRQFLGNAWIDKIKCTFK